MMTIRPMQAADIDPIVAWMLQIPLWQRYGFAAERGARLFNRAFAQGDLLRVADLADVPACGFCRVVLKGAFARSPYLQLIGVHPDHAGLGIGAALLTAAEEAVRPNHRELFLLASDFNTGAQRFYQRQGYQHIGTIPGYVLPDIDELIFWKRLPAPID
jgi:ribosomal protein S18 acetylase RimI-like enzyme